MSRIVSGRRADDFLREGAGWIGGRVLRWLSQRSLIRQHGQPRLAHLSGQRREADRTIHDRQASHEPAAFRSQRSGFGGQAHARCAALVATAQSPVGGYRGWFGRIMDRPYAVRGDRQQCADERSG